jgi:hypothetical protein
LDQPSRATRPGLEIDEDLRFQLLAWRAQRVGWCLVVAVLVAAVLGVFGGGPLSSSRSRSGILELEYQRFERRQAPSVLHTHLRSPPASEGKVSMWLDRGYVDRVRVDSVTPTPFETALEADRLVYWFRGRPGGDLRVTWRVSPERVGLVRGRLGTAGGPAVEFWQFVYP